MSDGRRVLIVAGEFPPIKTIGRLRSARFAAHLAELGWQPRVLGIARSPGIHGWDERLLHEVPPGVPVWRAPWPDLEAALARRLKRLAGTAPGPAPAATAGDAHAANAPAADAPTAATTTAAGLRARLAAAFGWSMRTLVHVPDDYIGWAVAARRLALEVCAREGVDVVLTSLPPFSACLVGAAVARRFNVPWVIDYRDLWHGDVLRAWMGPVRRRVELGLERHFVGEADLVVAVSEEKQRYLETLHPRARARFETLTNGYDPEVYDPLLAEPRDPRRGVEFVYTGRLFKNRRGYAFAEALGRLARRAPALTAPVRVRLLGGVAPEIRARWDAILAEYGIAAQVEFAGDLEHHASMRAQVQTDWLLLIVDTGETSDGVIPGKLFEYVAARRPIFALCDPGATPRIIEQARIGTVVPAESVEACEAALERVLSAPVPATLERDEDFLAQFERRAISRRLAALLGETVAAGRGGAAGGRRPAPHA